MLNTVDPNDPIIKGSIVNITSDKQKLFLHRLKISNHGMMFEDFDALNTGEFVHQGISFCYLNFGSEEQSEFRLDFDIFTRAIDAGLKLRLLDLGLLDQRCEWLDWVEQVRKETGLQLKIAFKSGSSDNGDFKGFAAEIIPH